MYILLSKSFPDVILHHQCYWKFLIFVVWYYQFGHAQSINFLLNSWVFAEASTVPPNGNKTFLANGASTFFVNDIRTLINEARNHFFVFITFSVVPFNKISLFSEDVVTFEISFISAFADVVPEPSICFAKFEFCFSVF